MVIGKSTTGGVDTGRRVTLRVIGVFCPVIVAATPVLLFVLGLLIFGRGLMEHHSGGLFGMLGFALPQLFVWCRRAVLLGPSGLVTRTSFASRMIGWDEIDGVRVEVGGSPGSSDSGTPLLELRDGGELLLDQLTAPSRSRFVPRSTPARHVKIIASYLDRYRARQD